MLNFTHTKDKENYSYIEMPFFLSDRQKFRFGKVLCSALVGKRYSFLAGGSEKCYSPYREGFDNIYLSKRKENAFIVFLSNLTSKNEMQITSEQI